MRNQFDIVIVGKNYLSLIFGLIKIQQGHSVILIDDPRVRLKGKWTSNLGPLEINLLKLIGEEHGIIVNQNIEEFLDKRDTTLFLDQKIIELTDSPYTNLKEIIRKLTNSIDESKIAELAKINTLEFDAQIDDYLNNTAKSIFKFKNYQNYQTELLSFLETTQAQSLKFNNDEDSLFDNSLAKLFITSLEFLYQSYFSNNKKEIDYNYLIAESLAPRKNLDLDSYENELLFEFKQLGGILKSTKIQEWHFYSHKVDSLLLESFEGVVLPQNCFYFGNIYENSPFELNFKERVFKSLNFEIKLNNDVLDSYSSKRLVFLQNSRVGTDFPFWELYLEDDNILKGTYAFVKQEGAKPEFFYQNAKKDVYDSLLKILPDLDWYLWSNGINFSVGDDLWLEDNDYQARSLSMVKLKKRSSNLRDKETGRSLKGIEYWGPLRSQNFGLISYLMELKDFHFRAI